MKTISAYISTFIILHTICSAQTSGTTSAPAFTMAQTISDGAQRATLAFSGLAMMTGNLDAQSFFPPGKVADYTGFQYLRDNDPDNMGHNTSFLTRIANNVLYILSDTQLAQLKALAIAQQDQISLYGYKRFALMKAFRRLLDGDIPADSTGLDVTAVKRVSHSLYLLDGQISFDRALLYANIYQSMTPTQKAYLDAMKGNGWSSWPNITNDQIRNRMRGLSQGVSVAMMTSAGDLFSWYAGSLEADVYFCPERQGTYFGSFYIKDAPAIGHEGYSIDEQLTATAGAALCDSSKGYVTASQASVMSGLVTTQRNNLYAGAVNIVSIRTQIASLLRSLLVSTDSQESVRTQVLALSGTYGDLDGENNYSYATVFAQVHQSLSDSQKVNISNLRQSIMSGTYTDGTPFDFSVCTTPFLYSSVISDLTLLSPYIDDTDYLFTSPTVSSLDSVGDGIPDWWRAKHFGGDGKTITSTSAATSDPDHDGMNNFSEYIADSIPTNPLSALSVRTISMTNGFTLTFASSVSRNYTLYYSIDLTSGLWTAIPSQTNIPGSGSIDALTDPSPTGPRRFYRIEVQLP